MDKTMDKRSPAEGPRRRPRLLPTVLELAERQPRPRVTYDLTSVVHGDEFGPQTETLFVTGDQYEQPSDGIVSTPSSGTRVTVTLTKVEAE
jgi:hypothetical protein